MPAGAVYGFNQSVTDRVTADREHHRDRRGCSFCGERPGIAGGHDDGHLVPNEFRNESRKPVELALGKAALDGHVLPAM